MLSSLRSLRWLKALGRFVRGGIRRSSAAVEPVRWRWRDIVDASDCGTPTPLVVELAAGASWDLEAARAWLAAQSFRPLWLARLDDRGKVSELLDAAGQSVSPSQVPAGRWRVAATRLPAATATRIEEAFLVVASEGIDRLILGDLALDDDSRPDPPIEIYRSDRFRRNPVNGELIPVRPGLLTKRLPASRSVPQNGESGGTSSRRGPYESDRALPLPLEVDVFDAARYSRRGPPPRAPRILVLAPFLARGGAEQTLEATCRYLVETGAFEFAFATLAPHRDELGDRRRAFADFAPWLYSLGDLMHPAAMYGALLSLIDTLDIALIYNANGSTLFYEFARRLRHDRPRLPIVDHLYDHRVGYIEWYTPDLAAVVDRCVAENHPIALALDREHGFPIDRAPVIWPCGRPPGAFPPLEQREEIRRRLRRELAIDDGRMLVLTAARAHAQKRPLDWVRLAERLRDRPVELLWVGGGDLERELDHALRAAGLSHARRLPFRADIPELLLAADLACLVSEFEGLPVFLLEALQAGRPFVSTDVGDIARALNPSGGGIVAGPPGDLDALERAIVAMLDPTTRSAAGAAAARAAGPFGVPACAEKYAAVFRAALASMAAMAATTSMDLPFPLLESAGESDPE
ncbi:MAG: glycosyltransferase [Thermoanaerobaculia bacterium]